VAQRKSPSDCSKGLSISCEVSNYFFFLTAFLTLRFTAAFLTALLTAFFFVAMFLEFNG
jgi:hypothetical protein